MKIKHFKRKKNLNETICQNKIKLNLKLKKKKKNL